MDLEIHPAQEDLVDLCHPVGTNERESNITYHYHIHFHEKQSVDSNAIRFIKRHCNDEYLNTIEKYVMKRKLNSFSSLTVNPDTGKLI